MTKKKMIDQENKDKMLIHHQLIRAEEIKSQLEIEVIRDPS